MLCAHRRSLCCSEFAPRLGERNGRHHQAWSRPVPHLTSQRGATQLSCLRAVPFSMASRAPVGDCRTSRQHEYYVRGLQGAGSLAPIGPRSGRIPTARDTIPTVHATTEINTSIQSYRLRKPTPMPIKPSTTSAQSTNRILAPSLTATSAIDEKSAEDANELPQRQSLLDHRPQQILLALALWRLWPYCLVASIGVCHRSFPFSEAARMLRFVTQLTQEGNDGRRDVVPYCSSMSRRTS